MKDKIELLKSRLLKKNVSHFEIYLDHTQGRVYKFQDFDLDTVEFDESVGFGLRVNREGKVGFSYGTAFDDTSLDFVIENALASSQFSTPYQFEPFVTPGLTYPMVNNFDSSLESLSINNRKDLVREMVNEALKVDSRIKYVRDAYYGETKESLYLVNSLGLELHHERTQFSLSGSALIEEEGESELGFDSDAKAFFSDLDPLSLGKQLGLQAKNLIGGIPIDEEGYPILLSPQASVEFLEVLASSFLYESVFKKNSLLENKLGIKVFSEEINIRDEALSQDGEESCPFDGEGIPTQSNQVVTEGVLNTYLYDRFWAHQACAHTTANSLRNGPLDAPVLATNNFYVENGDESIEELYNRIHEGIRVIDVIGMHTADPVSGDFSVGIQGHLIRDGEAKEPIRSVTMSGNVHDLFEEVIGVGNDLKFYESFGSPSLLIEELYISGEAED